MGSTSQQGWYLFVFIVGFTLGPAGLAGLGWPVALVGFGMIAASFMGFRSIKEPAVPGNSEKESKRAPIAPAHAAGKGF